MHPQTPYLLQKSVCLSVCLSVRFCLSEDLAARPCRVGRFSGFRVRVQHPSFLWGFRPVSLWLARRGSEQQVPHADGQILEIAQ